MEDTTGSQDPYLQMLSELEVHSGVISQEQCRSPKRKPHCSGFEGEPAVDLDSKGTRKAVQDRVCTNQLKGPSNTVPYNSLKGMSDNITSNHKFFHAIQAISNELSHEYQGKASGLGSSDDVDEKLEHSMGNDHTTTSHSSKLPNPIPGLISRAERSDIKIQSSYPAEPSSIPSTKVDDTASEAPVDKSNQISLAILADHKVYDFSAFIKSCTRAAILEVASAFCIEHRGECRSLRYLMRNGHHLTLESVRINGLDMDLSKDNADDLSVLIQRVEAPDLPRISVRLLEGSN